MNEQDRPASGGGSRKTVTTGSFRFAQARLRGVVVRDGPVTRYSQAGTPWTECTLLVGLYDGRQKCERELPAFVRVKFRSSAGGRWSSTRVVRRACSWGRTTGACSPQSVSWNREIRRQLPL